MPRQTFHKKNHLQKLTPIKSSMNKTDLQNPDGGFRSLIPTQAKQNELEILEKSSFPATPKQDDSRTGSPYKGRPTRYTPLDHMKTLGASQRLRSNRRAIAVTPHGKAAQRELYLRAGLTPSGNRRESERNQQRKTPRDDLRALSRLLASKSHPTEPPSNPPTISKKNEEEEGEEEDEIELARPRLSLALRNDDDEDDSFLLPPQSACLEDENITVKSLEIGRRAVFEKPPGRLSQGSFGSIRMSDVFTETSEIEPKVEADESSYLVNFKKDEFSMITEDNERLVDETGTLRFTTIEGAKLSPIGYESGIRRDYPAAEDTDTFVLTVPSRGEPERLIQSEAGLNLPDTQIGELDDLSSDKDTNSPGDQESKNDEISLEEVPVSTNDPKVFGSHPIGKKKLRVSKYGILCPSLPIGVVKKLAITFAKAAGSSSPKLNKETLDAIMQATDWFFEQAGDDLKAYAMHARRKTIDESDMITLMKRQRQINATTTPFFLAQRYLPRELLQELRMNPHFKKK